MRPKSGVAAMGPWRQCASVVRHVWNHPSNEGRRARQLLHALWFQARGRLAGLDTVTAIGQNSVMLGIVHRASALVVYANPPDRAEMLYWKNILRPGDLFIDVGASVGSYTLWAAELGAEVVAFEPHAETRHLLERNLALNSYEVQVRAEALSESVETLQFTSSLGPMNHVARGAGLAGTPATTLDEVLAGRRARGVKIDVEGFERCVIAGAMTSLKERRIDYLQIEWNAQSMNNYGESRAPVLDLLRSVGYSLARPDGTEVTADPGADIFAIAPGVDGR
jgi:FkbM family methyltransferase